MSKMIDTELCKQQHFADTASWYMHKIEFSQENKTHKYLCDLETQTGRPELIATNKNKRFSPADFAVITDYRVKVK